MLTWGFFLYMAAVLYVFNWANERMNKQAIEAQNYKPSGEGDEERANELYKKHFGGKK